MAYSKGAVTLYFGRDYHCGFIGYQVKKKPHPNMDHNAASGNNVSHGLYQPVVLAKGSSSGAIGAKTFLAAGASQGVNVSYNHVPTYYHRNSQGKNSKIFHQNESVRVMIQKLMCIKIAQEQLSKGKDMAML